MKILLLGEYSALHKNLKEGLQELGHDALVAASGDGFKKVPVDISFDSTLPSLLGRIARSLNHFTYLPKLKGFDVVQVINPFILHNRLPLEYFFKRIKSQNKKFFLLGAGDDAFFWRYGRPLLKYGPFDDFLKFDLKSSSSFFETDRAYDLNRKVLDMSNGLIPVMYEYEISYSNESKRLPTIPIPINTQKIEYRDNIISNKIIIFHGLNRYGFKGTRHVEDAFKTLHKKYPNDLELIIDGKMPLSEYLELMKRTNVIIDQMYSHSLGVNGVYAMAMGKVVMGGAEPESLNSLGVDQSPVINLLPNVKSIVDAVERLMETKGRIKDIGFESRQFAENIHGHVNIAQKYINTWNEN